MKKYIYIILLLTGTLTNAYKLMAQETAKIITHRVEKTLEYDGKGVIVINAERGSINIQSWKRNEVSVILKLTVKNTDINMAKKELGYIKYNLIKSRNNVFLNNSILLPNSSGEDEISSIIKAEYEVYVPEKIHLQVNNTFGKVSIKNVGGKIIGDLHYCDLSLQNYNGYLNVNIAIGDFNCLQSFLTGEIKTKHSNIAMNDIKGILTMTADYGSLKLSYGEKPAELAITSNATEITIDNLNCHALNIQLNGTYCPLKINSRCYTPDKSLLESSYPPASEQKSWLLKYNPAVKSGKLKVSATFGSLSLM